MLRTACGLAIQYYTAVCNEEQLQYLRTHTHVHTIYIVQLCMWRTIVCILYMYYTYAYVHKCAYLYDVYVYISHLAPSPSVHFTVNVLEVPV